MIDVWVVEKQLGSGGMGSVYRCHNRSATRILAAVKVLDRGLRHHSEASARFVREADILGQVDHPNVVKVRNVRHEHDPPYLEMEFVSGRSLDDRLARGALTYHECRQLLTQCADALVYLHARNIRHRDLKPANLLIQDDGTVKLVDFGLAVEVDRSRITQEGMAFGTVSYAPPEWIAPDTMDPVKWDLYALGVVVWEAMTGRVAFPMTGHGSARQQAMQVIVSKQHHPPLDPGSAFPDEVRSLIRDLTQPDPEVRIGDAAVALERVRRWPDHARPGGANVTLAPVDLFADPAPSAFPQPVGVLRSVPSSEGDARPSAALATTPMSERPAQEVRGSRVSGVALAAFGGVGAAMAAATTMVALGIGLVAWVSTRPAPIVPRAVSVRVHGAPTELVDVVLGDRPVDAVAGETFTFDAVPPGPSEVRWTVGAGCTVAGCAQRTCPDWCWEGGSPVEVLTGDGTQELAVEVEAASRRAVRLSVEGLPPKTPVVVSLAGVPGVTDPTGWSFAGVAPGPAELVVNAGVCSVDQPACWPTGACPPGCLKGTSTIEVPARGAAPRPNAVALPFEPVKAPPPETVPTSTSPGPAAAPKASGGWATVGMLADFLAANPGWQLGGELAGSGAAYLKGWRGATPPPGTDRGTRATGVTGRLARKVCQHHRSELLGGLEAVEDLEFRFEQGAVVLMESSDAGTTRIPLSTDTALSGAHWRCR